MTAGLVGADLEAMAALVRNLEAQSTRLHTVSAGATSAATGLTQLWRGPDAAEFHRQWMSGHRPKLLRAAEELAQAAARVERNLRAQETTSAADVTRGPGRHADPGPSPAATADTGGTGKFTDGARITGWSAVDAPLFRAADGAEDPIDANDIDQSRLRDCYFVSALAGLANADPALIADAIVDNGDGTYTVTLHQRIDGELRPVQVTVDNTMPVTERYNAKTDSWVAVEGYTAGEGDGELWPRIFEKAYASLLGDGDLVDGYGEIIGGDGRRALEVLTGVEGSTVGTGGLTIERLATMHGEGAVLPASQRHIPGSGFWFLGRDTGNYEIGDDEFVTRHQYWVESVDVDAGTVTVRNPWGYDDYRYELTMDEFNDAFREIDHAPAAR